MEVSLRVPLVGIDALGFAMRMVAQFSTTLAAVLLHALSHEIAEVREQGRNMDKAATIFRTRFTQQNTFEVTSGESFVDQAASETGNFSGFLQTGKFRE